MSKFSVIVTLRPYKKGKEEIQLTEEYTEWADADKAFCGYRTVCEIRGSKVEHVELVEHRSEVSRAKVGKDIKPACNNDEIILLGDTPCAQIA
jgi:hypothetical protein